VLPAAPGTLRWDVASIDGAVDAEAAFTELSADRPYAFWLDSSRCEPGPARFSFLGDDAGPLAEVLTYRTGTRAVEVRRGGRAHTEPGTIFEVLDRRLARRRLPDTGLPFDFAAGYVGYFGYEAKADCGGSNAHVAETPDAVWLFADRLVAIDHREQRTYVLAVSPGGPAQEAARAWIDRTAARLRGLATETSTVEFPDPPGGRASDGVPLSRSQEQYLADIGTCAAELRRGESYEICLTNLVRLAPVDDPLAYYRVLRRINPAPYGAYLRLAGVTVLSSSPERFLRIDRDGTVESRPVKGTTPRGGDPHRDEELRRSLVTSAKTRAEHLMIVDLLRSDLGRVCETGSVEVPLFMVTETYATVHQLVSAIRGRLRPSVSPVRCVQACFPGGSMTGAPKLRTMEIIDRLEREARGVYSGTLGYFGLGGGCDLSIVIRTAVATATGVTIGTGGAIVLDSDPRQEFAETMLKAEALLRAHRLATRLSR
jgi:para-aminobenzoate synthetase